MKKRDVRHGERKVYKLEDIQKQYQASRLPMGITQFRPCASTSCKPWLPGAVGATHRQAGAAGSCPGLTIAGPGRSESLIALS